MTGSCPTHSILLTLVSKSANTVNRVQRLADWLQCMCLCVCLTYTSQRNTEHQHLQAYGKGICLDPSSIRSTWQQGPLLVYFSLELPYKHVISHSFLLVFKNRQIRLPKEITTAQSSLWSCHRSRRYEMLNLSHFVMWEVILMSVSVMLDLTALQVHHHVIVHGELMIGVWGWNSTSITFIPGWPEHRHLDFAFRSISKFCSEMP